MALRKTLAERLFNITKTSRRALTNYRISSTAAAASRISQNPTRNNAPDPGDNGVFRRFLHKAAMFQPTISPVGGENLMEKLITIDIARDRIRLDGLSPPPTMKAAEKEKEKEKEKAEGLTVEEAKKVLRAVKMEMVKDRLRMIERNWIPYLEFVRVCEEACSDRELGLQFAKSLDDAGNVIVLGNVVFLKPEQVTKAIEGVIPLPSANPNQNHPRRKEYEEMEKQKAVIDKKADALVRRELWCGLGYFVVQTAAFMRLTFWELSWDVMEPVCFFVTSSSVIGSYLFFLKTAKEPTFGGFYKSRFSTKQKKLMKLHDFDVERYNQLRKIFYPHYSPPSAKVPFSDTYTDTHTSSDYDENLKISALDSH